MWCIRSRCLLGFALGKCPASFDINTASRVTIGSCTASRWLQIPNFVTVHFVRSLYKKKWSSVMRNMFSEWLVTGTRFDVDAIEQNLLRFWKFAIASGKMFLYVLNVVCKSWLKEVHCIVLDLTNTAVIRRFLSRETSWATMAVVEYRRANSHSLDS